MDRKKYLELCIRYATIRKDVAVKPDKAPMELAVTFDGNKYYPNGYKLSFDSKGKPIHTAILHDIASNSTVYAKIDRVIG